MLLARMNEAALRLTRALVESLVEAIFETEQELDNARRAYQSACGKRRGMQVRGFGTMTLRQVCAYAPRNMRLPLNSRLSELSTGSISLGITMNNNKALIASGMERIMKVTSALQKATNDGPGTYRRRGFVPPPSNSVLVSSQV
ncbi:MAG: hypothetical protein ABI278_04425 [Candidatus Aquilonibacter sp.]